MTKRATTLMNKTEALIREAATCDGCGQKTASCQCARLVVGASGAVEAEYGSRADAPFTLAILIGDEITGVEGHLTLNGAKEAAEGSKFELLL